MSNVSEKQKQKEREAQLKTLRKELSQEITDQLPDEMKSDARPTQKFEASKIYSDEEAKRVIEAILFTSGKPITLADFKRALGGFSEAKIEKLVQELQAEYERDGRSFRINEIAVGFECATDPKYAPWILKL